MASLVTLFVGDFGTENDGEELHLQPSVAVTFPFLP
jgi:hypothetical protein